jgi:hypothetical protein
MKKIGSRVACDTRTHCIRSILDRSGNMRRRKRHNSDCSLVFSSQFTIRPRYRQILAHMADRTTHQKINNCERNQFLLCICIISDEQWKGKPRLSETFLCKKTDMNHLQVISPASWNLTAQASLLNKWSETGICQNRDTSIVNHFRTIVHSTQFGLAHWLDCTRPDHMTYGRRQKILLLEFLCIA